MAPNHTFRWVQSALAVSAAGLLCASGAVHLDLYVTGYRRIPTIGNLFLLQAAVGVALGIAALVTSRAARPRALTSLAGALFALGTVVAYSLSRGVGLFGFHEQPSTAGLVAGVLEVGAFVAFGALVISGISSSGSEGRSVAPGSPDREAATRHGRRVGSSASRAYAGTTGAVATGLLTAVLAFGLGSSAPSTTPRGRPASRPTTGVAVVHVRISDYEFHPDRVRAMPGEVIAVTNDDQVTHTLTAIPGSVPYGVFDTGYVDPGRTVRIHAPRTPGSYDFYCSIHNFMKGVLIVTP